ncbi:MAG: ABC transporter ATP-binding protein [Crenarchaeota archaeon]|nr:ABC transporter ATP-binding protein [Thermoproteota archaeon]
MVEIRVEGVKKRFGKTVALAGVSLHVKPGELFAILGPSGCGKTTLLRIIAGFEYPDEGRVYFDGRDVTDMRPDERGAVMVFQNWALWPHMTVYDNIAYGLRIRKVPEDEIRKRVKRVLQLLGIEGLEHRYPHQLSGGQQQRVALARALVVEPKVLLLDEPLSNLDAKLRLRLRGEIRKLQRRLGITAIYVTHDQEEALAVADRVAVMHAGRIEQIGTPEEVYKYPRTLFTAVFLGKTSVLRGKVLRSDGDYVLVSVGSHRIKAMNCGVKEGDVAAVIIKAEAASLEPHDGATPIEGDVTVSMYIGSYVETRIAVNGQGEIIVNLPPAMRLQPGRRATLYLDPNLVYAFPYEAEEIRELAEEA